MALVVNTNMDALMIENTLTNTNYAVSASVHKLLSALRIKSAKADPAGLAIANSIAAKIAAMQFASQNAGETQSMPPQGTKCTAGTPSPLVLVNESGGHPCPG